MSLRPLFDNVWGVPVQVQSITYGGGPIERPVMSQNEKILHLILVCETGKDCRELKNGEIVILPDDNNGAVVEVLTNDGKIERRYCFKESKALAIWEGAFHGELDSSIIEPRSF